MGFLRVYLRTLSLSSRAFLRYRDSLIISEEQFGSLLRQVKPVLPSGSGVFQIGSPMCSIRKYTGVTLEGIIEDASDYTDYADDGDVDRTDHVNSDKNRSSFFLGNASPSPTLDPVAVGTKPGSYPEVNGFHFPST